MITRQLLAEATDRLADANIEMPKLDAECLLAQAWHTNRAGLIAHSTDEVPGSVSAEFEAMLRRRIQREPLAYITGEKEFWSRDFAVNPAVLIPRPETEHLIEAALTAFPDTNQPLTVCDIGTGSGCIAVTLACELVNAHVVATDISTIALDTAADNARRHGVGDRLTFRHGNLFDALAPTDGPFDLIVSNPPYVAADEMDSLEPELAFEPRGALTDEADGLSLIQEILAQGAKHLKPTGLLMIETGVCGLPKVPPVLRMVRTIDDLAGHLRTAVYCHL